MEILSIYFVLEIEFSAYKARNQHSSFNVHLSHKDAWNMARDFQFNKTLYGVTADHGFLWSRL